jgi:hypothetical protein
MCIHSWSDITLYFDCPEINMAYIELHNKGHVVNNPFNTQYGWEALIPADPYRYLLRLPRIVEKFLPC